MTEIMNHEMNEKPKKGLMKIVPHQKAKQFEAVYAFVFVFVCVCVCICMCLPS